MHTKQKEQAQEITTELGQALRQADSLVFHYREGQSFIRCIKENVGVWKESKEVRIDCGTFLENFRVKANLGDIRSASHFESNSQYNRVLTTLLSKIKKGDKLSLKWIANNNNNLLDEVGLYKDELNLVIHRKGSEEYNVAISVSKNNSAKMVKNESTPLSVAGD